MHFEKCVSCGRFIGFDNYVVSAPYGGPTDLDPPDDEYICLRCWDGWDEARRALHYRVSYLKPMIVRNGRKEHYISNAENNVSTLGQLDLTCKEHRDYLWDRNVKPSE